MSTSTLPDADSRFEINSAGRIAAALLSRKHTSILTTMAIILDAVAHNFLTYDSLPAWSGEWIPNSLFYSLPRAGR
jgi:hypothetical protein